MNKKELFRDVYQISCQREIDEDNVEFKECSFFLKDKEVYEDDTVIVHRIFIDDEILHDHVIAESWESYDFKYSIPNTCFIENDITLRCERFKELTVEDFLEEFNE